MKLADQNFGNNEATFRHAGKNVRVMLYYYESHNGLYDVARFPWRGGVLSFRTNMGEWRTHSPEPIHKAIIRHFGLDSPE